MYVKGIDSKSKVQLKKQYEATCDKSKVEEWLELVNPTPWTRQNYMFSLKLYCEFHSMISEATDSVIEYLEYRNKILDVQNSNQFMSPIISDSF